MQTGGYINLFTLFKITSDKCLLYFISDTSAGNQVHFIAHASTLHSSYKLHYTSNISATKPDKIMTILYK
jgi:hypothetical protein